MRGLVDLTAPDGINLKATYFAAGRPGPGVLLLHQCNRQRKVWDDLAERLAASGLNVLTLDFRGFGESGGTPLDKHESGAFAEAVLAGVVCDRDAGIPSHAVQLPPQAE